MADKEYQQRILERATFWEAKNPEMERDMLSHPFFIQLQDYYRDYCVTNLASNIAIRKVRAGIYGPDLLDRFEQKQLQHVEYGFELLKLILYKKLFNLQLEWRANRITLPEIEVGSDFESYAWDIFNCPFLEPISERELNVLKLYMQTFNFDAHVGWFGMPPEWQDYDELMEKNERGERDKMPDFYEFYDGQMGTFYLVDLPNERGEAEKKFLEAGLEKHRARHAARVKKEQESNIPPPKPHFHAEIELHNLIFRETEPPEFFVWKAALEKPVDYEVNAHYEYIDELNDISDMEVRLPGWLPWDEGMEKALQNYRLAKAAEVLDLSYEQYLMKAELHLFDTSDVEERKKGDYTRKFILDGMGLP